MSGDTITNRCTCPHLCKIKHSIKYLDQWVGHNDWSDQINSVVSPNTVFWQCCSDCCSPMQVNGARLCIVHYVNILIKVSRLGTECCLLKSCCNKNEDLGWLAMASDPSCFLHSLKPVKQVMPRFFGLTKLAAEQPCRASAGSTLSVREARWRKTAGGGFDGGLDRYASYSMP